MSYRDGWSAVQLQMPARVPRIEFGAESHWPLVHQVTGIQVEPHSPEIDKERARGAFAAAWNYDLCLASLIGHDELDTKRTSRGHGVYEAGGIDYDARVYCPFREPEEVYAFDPWETYGPRDKSELVARFNAHYRAQCERYPDLVNTTGTYVTLFSGLISIFGWEMLLTAGGLDPAALGEVAHRYASWMQPYYDALAACEASVIYSHDDIVWTAGAVFRPQWYRDYIFPHYAEFYRPLLEAGKKPLFISDGNYTEFVDDIAAAGAQGFFFEPLTDLVYIVEHYGDSHIIIGNVDTRALLSGSHERIRGEVERCMALGKHCPGYFIGVTNMIPANTPVDSALYYNQVYEELCWR
ncbi:MAG: hypothetical protein JXA74_13185 [Anaerolineae bacterium]|nr:hypothetical protein [Anaerolineae bacterium]